MSQGVRTIKDSEYEYDDKEEVNHFSRLFNRSQGLYAEKVALNTNTQINLRAMPLKTYLDQTVMPALTKGLTELCKKK